MLDFEDNRFLAERLGEQLQRAGLAQPNIREFPVYAEERA
jgi:hypothetical protein